MPISLEQASGTYEAILYAWEGGNKCYDLITEEGTVLITRSLCFALRRFRLKGEIHVLWADAVCINQEDNSEKGKQVSIMSDIYSLATRTLVYLGEAADNSEMALNLLEKIARADIDDNVGATNLSLEFCLFGLPPEGDPAWKALKTFWGRSWFRRVWVIQEFVRSLDVLMVCGTWQGNWMTFCSAAQKCRLFLYTSPTIFNVFESMTMDVGVSAMTLMADIRSRCIGITFQSVAPGDKLDCIGPEKRMDVLQNLSSPFSPPESGCWPATMSSMHQRRLNDCRKSSPLFRMGEHETVCLLCLGFLTPDYTIPFEDVVRRYGKAFMRNGQCMELLYKCRDGSQTYRFPSWIPDWTTKYVGLRVDAVRESLGNSNLYRASGDSKSQASVNDIEDSLIVRGGFVDTAMWTGTIPMSTSQDINIPTSFSRVHGIAWPLYLIREAHTVITSLPFYPTGEPLEEVLWRTLIANKTHKGLKAPDDFGSKFVELHQRKDGFLEALESLSPRHARDWLIRSIGEPYYESLMEIFPQYKLVITKNFYVGIVPLLTEAGDRICVLNGGAVPFFLMERKKPKMRYRLIGECYIHGIMNGEVFRKKGWREEEIPIY